MKIWVFLIMISFISGCAFNHSDHRYLKARNNKLLIAPQGLTNKNLQDNYYLPDAPKSSQVPSIKPPEISEVSAR